MQLDWHNLQNITNNSFVYTVNQSGSGGFNVCTWKSVPFFEFWIPGVHGTRHTLVTLVKCVHCSSTLFLKKRRKKARVKSCHRDCDALDHADRSCGMEPIGRPRQRQLLSKMSDHSAQPFKFVQYVHLHLPSWILIESNSTTFPCGHYHQYIFFFCPVY